MRYVRIASALLFLASGTSLAQFEGVAEFKMTSGSRDHPIMRGRGTMSFSRSAARSDWEFETHEGESAEKPAGAPHRHRMSLIVRLSDPDKLYMVNDERKSYSVVNLKDLQQSTAGDDDPKRFQVRKLGRRDTVAGLSCEAVQVTAPSGTESEYCVTRELPISREWLAALHRDRRGGSRFAALQAQGIDGFPIRIVTRESSDPRAASTMELVRVERKSVPASAFEIPAGYRETSGMGLMMTPEQEKAMNDALEKMTPEQRKMYEEMMKKKEKKDE